MADTPPRSSGPQLKAQVEMIRAQIIKRQQEVQVRMAQRMMNRPKPHLASS